MKRRPKLKRAQLRRAWIAAIRKAKRLGHPLTITSVMREDATLRVWDLRAAFGTWGKALKAAGAKKEEGARRMTLRIAERLLRGRLAGCGSMSAAAIERESPALGAGLAAQGGMAMVILKAGMSMEEFVRRGFRPPKQADPEWVIEGLKRRARRTGLTLDSLEVVREEPGLADWAIAHFGSIQAGIDLAEA